MKILGLLLFLFGTYCLIRFGLIVYHAPDLAGIVVLVFLILFQVILGKLTLPIFARFK